MAQRPTSSGLINLQNFLSLNQSTGSALGQRIADGVNTQSQQAESQVQGLNNTFNQQVRTATPSAPDLTGLSIEEQKKKLAEAAGSTYKGPMSIEELEGYGDVASAASGVARTGQALGTDDGRAEAIRQVASAPGYNSNQNSVDSFLAGASTGGRTAIQGAQSRASGLRNFLTGNVQGSRDSANAAKDAVKKMADDAQGRLNELNKPRDTPLPRQQPGRPQGYKGDQLEANGVEYDANGRRVGTNGPRSGNARRGPNYDRGYIP